jgi:hypothetical protein
MRMLLATPAAFVDVGEHPISFPGHHRQQAQRGLKLSKFFFATCSQFDLFIPSLGVDLTQQSRLENLSLPIPLATET